ncbi:acyltransferase domain-containing protein [Nocardia asteroides]
MFPGQGAQYPQMAAGLYRREPTFTAAMDEVFDAFGVEGERLRIDWLSDTPSVPIDHVTRAQPLLFAVDYALGRMVVNWGLRPDVLIGHSIGELAAAVFAEILPLSEVAGMVLDRVRHLAAAPPGAMLAVAAGVDELAPYLINDVAVAAINAPRQTILAGPNIGIDAVADKLRGAGTLFQRVPATTAFHSPMLAAAAAASLDDLASIRPSTPRTPVYSCYTTGPLDDATISDPAYWASHPVATVRFWQTLDAMITANDAMVCVETGPGQGLSRIARRHPAARRGNAAVVPVSPGRPGGDGGDWKSAAAAYAQLSALCVPAP